MQNPATLDDLADRWFPNPLGDSDAAANASVRLDEAWRALQDELPGIVARITAGSVSVNSVIDVVCAASLRVLRNPDQWSEASASIDDASESWKLDRSALSNDLYFTTAELRRLSVVGSGAFTITPGRR